MTTKEYPTKTTMELQKENEKLKIEVAKYEKTKQSKRIRQRRYYNNKFKINESLSDEEKEKIIENKKRLNSLAQKRYNKNPEKNRTRCRNNYFEKLSPEKQKLYLIRKAAREERKAMEDRKQVYINSYNKSSTVA